MNLRTTDGSRPQVPEFVRELREKAELVGTLPPAPPTLRGSAGQLAVRVLRPLLAWYTTQLRAFQQASARAHHTEFERIRRLAEIVNRHEHVLNSSDPDLVEKWDEPGAEAAAGTAGAHILDQIVSTFPCDQNALDIFKDEWLSMMPTARRDLRAGPIPLFEDPRIYWAVSEMGGVENRRVLELGPMEGGHTYILQQCGAASVLSIESNMRAFLKCLIVKNLFKLDRVEFRCGDVVSYLRQSPEPFDAVIASGVLYHMVNPVELLELVSRVTGRLFIWTHYYDEAIVSANAGVGTACASTGGRSTPDSSTACTVMTTARTP